MTKIKKVKEFECTVIDTVEVAVNKVIVKSYNTLGYLMEIEEFEDEEMEKLKTKIINEYDNQGNLIIEREYDNNRQLKNKSTFGYNELNQIISKYTFTDEFPDAEIMWEQHYTYNEQGQLIIDKYVDSCGNTIIWHNEYDELGKKKTGRLFFEEGESQWEVKVLYSYNDKGDIDSVTTYDYKGRIQDRETNVYEYDDYNNWIKCYKKFSNQEQYIEREIEYY